MRKKSVGMITMILIVLAAPGILGEAPIRIDNSYLDWKQIPSLATFASRYDPVYFRREKDGKAKELEIEASLYWKKGGTLIREIKSYMNGEDLFIFVEVDSNISDELSVFLYPYSERDDGAINSFTIELVPERRDRPGAVLLWMKTSRIPVAVGELRNSSFSLECVIPLDSLPSSFMREDPEKLTFDLTTCYHETASGMYEEFFFTTVYFRDIVTPEDY